MNPRQAHRNALQGGDTVTAAHHTTPAGLAPLTTRVPGITPEPDDDTLCEALRQACLGVEARGPMVRIGLVGPDGSIYRLVLAHRPDQVGCVLDCLRQHRFESVPPYAGMQIVLCRPEHR